jgi:hypothetical protein
MLKNKEKTNFKKIPLIYYKKNYLSLSSLLSLNDAPNECFFHKNGIIGKTFKKFSESP